MNLASVNYHFGGKEGLYEATLKELLAVRTAQRPPERGAGVEALQRQVEWLLHVYIDIDRSSLMGRILAHEAMNPTAHFESLVTDIVRPEVERLRGAIEAIAGDRLDDEAVGLAAMSVLGQCLFYLSARGAVERVHPGFFARNSIERLARHIVAFSLGGLYGIANMHGGGDG